MIGKRNKPWEDQPIKKALMTLISNIEDFRSRKIPRDKESITQW